MGAHFRGPVIRPVNVGCWYAEPPTPSKCVGGVHGVQKVTAFVPTIDLVDPTRVDTSFHQKTLVSFAGGGMTSGLQTDKIPAGIFVSFKRHRIFAITQVQHPIQSEVLPFSGQKKVGAKIAFDFEHEPSNGECYFYVAPMDRCKVSCSHTPTCVLQWDSGMA